MTTTMDDETLQIFLEEAKEHLETIESDLLTIEQQGEEFDEEVVNKIFRAAHSLKGGAGFLGLTTMKELAHKLENVLQMVRNFQLVPTPEMISSVLAGFDRLAEMLEQPQESNSMDISGEIAALQQIVSSELPENQKESLHQKKNISHPNCDVKFEVNEFALSQAISGGKNLYILKFDLIQDAQQKDKSPLDLIKLLEDSGNIVDVHVDVEAVGDLDSESIGSAIPMSVLFASIVEADLLPVLLNIDPSRSFLIAEQMIREVRHKQEENPPAEPVQPTTESQAPAPSESQAEEPAKEPEPPAPKMEKQDSPAPKPKESKATAKTTKHTETKSESLRVSVKLLDELMNRAGELVLARNQLLESVQTINKQNLSAASQRINQVTSELQEAIMLTRMQPIGNVFNKFPRVVRDIARDLGKQINLTTDGNEVELDKTIIEGLGDPLTHLVRNSADHGIELPEARKKIGKPAQGKIALKAHYESGQVVIEIQDDGKGLDSEKIAEKAISRGLYSEDEIQSMSEKEKFNLIMLPGFSTAETVTDLSGRGVGMDVVKTNLDTMGGQIEIHSEKNVGTTIKIKLPLTLAIIPSLLVSSCGNRFALPQVNVGEMIRIPASEIREKIEKIGGADVLILRGELIPLLQLNNVLELEGTYYDYKTGTFKPDRRSGITDDRLANRNSEVIKEVESDAPEDDPSNSETAPERRSRRESDAVIVILEEGTFRYGLLVDAVHDTIEIVVKPLGRFFNNIRVYAGATIMGDGHVALILDVPGLARKAELKGVIETTHADKSESDINDKINGATRQSLLLFHNGPSESCAVPLYQVLRVEQIMAEDIEVSAGKKVIQYRGGHLPVYALEEVANVEMLEDREKLIVIIFVVAGNEVGLLAVQPLDVVEADFILDEMTLRQPGISGSMIINDKTTLMLDIFGMMQTINPQWFTEAEQVEVPVHNVAVAEEATESSVILLVEDSEFFRSQVKRFIEDGGYQVVEAEDGQVAWDYLNKNPGQIDLVVTDIEMPNMNGFELAKNIRGSDQLSHLQIIALTSLAAQEDVEKGKECGIDDYQIKLDKEKLLESLGRHI